MRYGMHPDRDVIRTGDLATWQTTGAGPVKVKVLGARTTNPVGPYNPKDIVTVRVTDRSNYIYPAGTIRYVSALWLDKRKG